MDKIKKEQSEIIPEDLEAAQTRMLNNGFTLGKAKQTSVTSKSYEQQKLINASN